MGLNPRIGDLIFVFELKINVDWEALVSDKGKIKIAIYFGKWCLKSFSENAAFVVEFSMIVKTIRMLGQFLHEIVDHVGIDLNIHADFFFIFFHF